MPDIVTSLLQMQQGMEEVRDGFEGSMQKAFDYVNPRRYDLQGGTTKGAPRQTKMYDGIAQDAFWDWVNGMIGWGVSENLKWQRAALAERDLRDVDANQLWLDEFTEQMDWEFRAGNFYDIIPEYLQDAGSGGTAAFLTEESLDLRRCVHRVPHPGRYWIAENADYEIDHYHEILTLTARKALEKYGAPSLHPTVVKWARDPQAASWSCDFLQCILPADHPAVFPQRLVRSRYALVTLLYALHAGSGRVEDSQLQGSADRLVAVAPLDYLSVTVWRFRRNSDELYGFSPAMDVMTAIEAAQQHAYNLMNMGNHAANPIKFIPDEKRMEWSFLPGAKNYYGAPDRLAQTIELAKEYPIAIDRENKLHELIRKRYGYGVWNVMPMFMEKRERNQATEVMEARADQARLLTGQMNNFWRGGIRPIYDAVAYLAARAGRMPEAPAELQDRRGQDIVTPLFVGPLADIQIVATKLSGVQQGLKLLADLAEIVGRHIGPEEAAAIYDRVNLPDLTEYVCDHTAFPQRLMRSDEEVQARQAARQRRLLQAEQAANAQKLAAASAQLGKPVAPNSLLMAGAA